MPCCSESGQEEGRLGHGDLHGLQHLLHRLHGAFVLLGPTTSHLRVREKVKKRDRSEGRREHWLIRFRRQQNEKGQTHLKAALLVNLIHPLLQWSLNSIDKRVKRNDSQISPQLFHKSHFVIAQNQDAHMISPLPWPLVQEYITLSSNFCTVSTGFSQEVPQIIIHKHIQDYSCMHVQAHTLLPN